MDNIQMLYAMKEECCGCSACIAICPHNALTMKVDEEGFEYPYLNKEKCVGCLLCVNVCPNKAK